jgi:hypothetical protein
MSDLVLQVLDLLLECGYLPIMDALLLLMAVVPIA